MYGHLVDSMRHTGKDARVPGALAGEVGKEWLGRDKPQTFPEHSRDYFEGLRSLRSKMDSDPARVASGRKAGDIKSFMLANNKLKNMARYHELHTALEDLVARHGADARAGVAELMAHKYKGGLHEAVRARAAEKGKPDPGPYTAGPLVPGLAPKTARYMYGMLGGGNTIVPDTHFTRYLFGLDKRADANTIAYLKNVLWNENSSKLLDGIDRYYSANHDAAHHMRQHPEWGKVFDSSEDAIFPAFWKNWTAIVPHERARGMKTGGANEQTTHRPYWEAIEPYVKHEHSYDLPLETAAQHADWVEQYGEMPALEMYYEHLVPKLLAASTETPVQKMERLARTLESTVVELRLAKAGIELEPNDPPVVHGELHGHYSSAPEQQALIHGFEPESEPVGRAETGINRKWSAWRHSPVGIPVYHKAADPEDSHHEVAYHNIARDFFGLGHYVPYTAAFKHPHTGEVQSVQQAVPGATHIRAEVQRHGIDGTVWGFGPPHAAATLQRLGDAGELDKLAVMNHVLGNDDRHPGNYVFSRQGPGLHLIDHGLAFEDGRFPQPPDYLDQYVHLTNSGQPGMETAEAHPEAVKWALSLDPDQLAAHLQRNGVKDYESAAALDRLVRLQGRLRDLQGAGHQPKKKDYFA